VINSNLGPISHRLATIHPLQTMTDGQTTHRAIDALRVKNVLGQCSFAITKTSAAALQSALT